MRRARAAVATAESALAESDCIASSCAFGSPWSPPRIGVFEWTIATGEMDLDEQVCAHWGAPAGASVNFESFLKAIHVDDRAAVQAAITRALDSNGSGAFSGEFRVTGVQDGIERWIFGTGQTVFQNGRASRFVGTSLDRTPYKHAEEALRASEERFRGLTQSSARHRFRMRRERRECLQQRSMEPLHRHDAERIARQGMDAGGASRGFRKLKACMEEGAAGWRLLPSAASPARGGRLLSLVHGALAASSRCRRTNCAMGGKLHGHR